MASLYKDSSAEEGTNIRGQGFCYLQALHCKTLKYTYSRLRNRDIFRQSISMTYRGKDTFSNIVGCASTFLIVTVLLGYSIILFRTMLMRTDVSWNLNSIQVDVTKESSPLIWTEEDPQFKFLWEVFQIPPNLDPNTDPFHYISTKYEHERVKHVNYTPTNLLAPDLDIRRVTNIPINDCSTTFPTTDDYKMNQTMSVRQCPVLTGFGLHGRWGVGEDHSGIVFDFSTCPFGNNYTNCADQAEIDQYIDKIPITMHLNNRYVDLNDIENPIKRYYDKEYRFQFRKDKIQRVHMKLRKHEVILEDSFFPFPWNSEPIYFNSIEDFEIFEEDSFSGLIRIEIVRDSQVDQHRRRVLNFLEVTGILGGIFELFEVCFGVLIGFYSSFMFRRKIYKDILKCERKFQAMQKSISELEKKVSSSHNSRGDSRQQQSKDLQEGQMKATLKAADMPPAAEPNSEVFKRGAAVIKDHEEAKARQLGHEDEKQHQDEHERMQRHRLRSELDDHPFRMFELVGNHRKSQIINDEEEDSSSDAFAASAKELGNEMAKFSNSLDCLNIVYSIKTLRAQTAYLLSKDPDYSEALKANPSLEVDFENIYASNQRHKVSPAYENPDQIRNPKNDQPNSMIQLGKSLPERAHPYMALCSQKP
ncbi:unnamed protein product [Moneuplotes crassus]|uniref:Uncharacterized protein n=1 Tax=Euplotes crassus TaxID=5936 RepID=A0AAD1U2P4_EUPCR|nr:unnamed protein product [Moneuplotes crassus]